MQSQSSHRKTLTILIGLVVFYCTFSCAPVSRVKAAVTQTSEIQDKINQRNLDIKNLEKEIANYQSQIDSLSGQASTLSSAVKSLQLTQKKLADDIKITDTKIARRTLEIQQLSSDITLSQKNINDDKRIITQTFATIHENDGGSLIETILGGSSISDTLDSLTKLGTIQSQLSDRIDSYKKDKASLESTKTTTEKARTDLLSLNKQKKDQQSVVASTANQQNSLLRDTKQSQSQYQSILAQKLQQQAAFEQEIMTYQSQLKTVVDSSKLPDVSTGVLSWPLDSVFITQYFGNTSFSTANPQIYNGKGHTGVDFRASIGTPVKAALSGTILATGNTDLVPGCYSYGKWVMIKHNNGLSTLYAHLSLPIVTAGNAVTTGQIIGYSGNTGYSTGPHLHFGAYASQGVSIQQLTTSKNCHNAYMPVGPFSAYLNPLSYLP